MDSGLESKKMCLLACYLYSLSLLEVFHIFPPLHQCLLWILFPCLPVTNQLLLLCLSLLGTVGNISLLCIVCVWLGCSFFAVLGRFMQLLCLGWYLGKNGISHGWGSLNIQISRSSFTGAYHHNHFNAAVCEEFITIIIRLSGSLHTFVLHCLHPFERDQYLGQDLSQPELCRCPLQYSFLLSLSWTGTNRCLFFFVIA